jgi:hypothetical protein
MDWRGSFAEMKRLHRDRLERERDTGSSRHYRVKGRTKWIGRMSTEDIEEIAFLDAEADVQMAINKYNERVRKHGKHELE